MIDSFTGKYRFLSNFYPAQVVFDGEIYPSVEHAYQAGKTFDEEKRREIRDANTPGEAKRLGKELKQRENWKILKYSIMDYPVFQKFNNDHDLRLRLLSTGDQELVEGNTWGDVYWGVCEGKGENNLGKILMRVRRDLQYV